MIKILVDNIYEYKLPDVSAFASDESVLKCFLATDMSLGGLGRKSGYVGLFRL